MVFFCFSFLVSLAKFYRFCGWLFISDHYLHGFYDFRTIFDVDIDGFEEKPWKYPGVDMSDFFNFGFNEDSWKDYCKQLVIVILYHKKFHTK